ncbi:hypothetical protein LIER_19544 [Lithospermum erythrorhizon]|uniref:Uncharacterized protein n=1 Tax=Lithospermum erythrorhizon TaxID=34254 RepID=A0AAV3QNQ9_LITER
MACFMARGERHSLTVPILSSIYRGLNLIVKSKNPSDAKTSFSIHYVYRWIASSFGTHYTTHSELEGPLMVKYSSKGGARYYNESSTYKHFQTNPVIWSCNKTNREATCPSHESKFRTSKSYHTWLKAAYAKDSLQESVHPPASVVNVPKEHDPTRPQLQLPSHGNGKQLRLFKNRHDPTLSPCDRSRTPEVTPQVSHAGKMKEILEEDEVDSIDDRNLKQVRSRVTVSPSKVFSGGGFFLQSTNETLDGGAGLNSEDSEILGSLVGDSSGMPNQKVAVQFSVFEGDLDIQKQGLCDFKITF